MKLSAFNWGTKLSSQLKIIKNKNSDKKENSDFNFNFRKKCREIPIFDIISNVHSVTEREVTSNIISRSMECLKCSKRRELSKLQSAKYVWAKLLKIDSRNKMPPKLPQVAPWFWAVVQREKKCIPSFTQYLYHIIWVRIHRNWNVFMRAFWVCNCDFRVFPYLCGQSRFQGFNIKIKCLK